MSKRGFTVLETMISLFIVLVLFSTILSVGFVEKNIFKDIESEGFKYEMHDFLTYAKLQSIYDKKDALININDVDKKVSYINNKSEVIQTLKIPDGIEFGNSRKINVNRNGVIKDSLTIMYKNYLNESKQIKIRTGVDYINLNDDK